MSEMIKRVTKAIEGAAFCVPDGPYNISKGDLEYLARAAVEAMREPTDDMIAAANRNNHPRDLETWQTMIDQALAEPGPLRPPGSADLYGVPRAEE